MAENVILQEQELTFTSVEGLLLRMWQAYPSVISLTDGEEYIVVWDGEEFPCKAIAANFNGVDGLGLGNFAIAGLGEDTGEPFLLGAAIDDSFSACYETENSDTHTVAIYQVVEEEPETPEEPEGIVLKDRNGNDVAYYGIETVTFDTTTEGKQQVYTKGTAVEGLEIVPDFSGGDMPVVAPEGALVKSAVIKTPAEKKTVALVMADGDMVIEPSAAGKLMSEVIVEKPDTLVPENIAEGVNIAGLVGTFAGGAVKIASGTFTSANTNTITHNLGVVPDILILFPTSSSFSTTTTYTASMMWGCSTAFKAAYSFFPGVAYPCRLTASDIRHYYYGRCIDQDYNSGYPNIIRDTNATTFTVNRASTAAPSIPANTSMRWIAIAGLT